MLSPAVVIAASFAYLTLLFAVASPLNVAPLVAPSAVRYDTFKDFTPIATVGVSPFVLIGRTALPAATMGELICERAGVLNLGIEGIMVIGAFAGWMAVYLGAPLWLGVGCAMICGMAKSFCAVRRVRIKPGLASCTRTAVWRRSQ